MKYKCLIFVLILFGSIATAYTDPNDPRGVKDLNRFIDPNDVRPLEPNKSVDSLTYNPVLNTINAVKPTNKNIDLNSLSEYLIISPNYWESLINFDLNFDQLKADLNLSVADVNNADFLDGQHGAYYLDRANHTGTQTASTISDFFSYIRSSADFNAEYLNVAVDLSAVWSAIDGNRGISWPQFKSAGDGNYMPIGTFIPTDTNIFTAGIMNPDNNRFNIDVNAPKVIIGSGDLGDESINDYNLIVEGVTLMSHRKPPLDTTFAYLVLTPEDETLAINGLGGISLGSLSGQPNWSVLFGSTDLDFQHQIQGNTQFQSNVQFTEDVNVHKNIVSWGDINGLRLCINGVCKSVWDSFSVDLNGYMTQPTFDANLSGRMGHGLTWNGTRYDVNIGYPDLNVGFNEEDPIYSNNDYAVSMNQYVGSVSDVTFNSVNGTIVYATGNPNSFWANHLSEWYITDIPVIQWGTDATTGYYDTTEAGLFWSNFDTGNARLELRTAGGNPLNFYAGTIYADAFSGNGANITDLNAEKITTGTIPYNALMGAVTDIGRGNLVRNGSAENSRLDWSANSGDGNMTIVRDTSTSKMGSISMKAILKSGSVTYQIVEYSLSTWNGTSSFKTDRNYSLSWWWKCSQAHTYLVQVSNSNNTNVVYPATNFTCSTSWERMSVVFTPLVTGNTPQIRWWINQSISPTADFNMWIDGVQLEQSNQVSGFNPTSIKPNDATNFIAPVTIDVNMADYGSADLPALNIFSESTVNAPVSNANRCLLKWGNASRSGCLGIDTYSDTTIGSPFTLTLGTSGYDATRPYTQLRLDSASATFNNANKDMNTIVKGIQATDVLHVDGKHNNVGINTSDPNASYNLDLNGLLRVFSNAASYGSAAIVVDHANILYQPGYSLKVANVARSAMFLATGGTLGTLNFGRYNSTGVYQESMMIFNLDNSDVNFSDNVNIDGNLASVENIVSDGNKTRDFGNSNKYWRDAYIQNAIVDNNIIIGRLRVNNMGGYEIDFNCDGTIDQYSIVEISPDANNSVRTSSSGSKMPVGIASNTCASGDHVWVTISGVQYVIFEDVENPQAGDIAYANSSGMAASSPTIPSVSLHEQEIGHVIEDGLPAGANQAVRVLLHFN